MTLVISQLQKHLEPPSGASAAEACAGGRPWSGVHVGSTLLSPDCRMVTHPRAVYTVPIPRPSGQCQLALCVTLGTLLGSDGHRESPRMDSGREGT